MVDGDAVDRYALMGRKRVDFERWCGRIPGPFGVTRCQRDPVEIRMLRPPELGPLDRKLNPR